MLIFFIFVFGACIGSFLNVCIYRLPLSQSIINPPSHCPGCKSPIKWYDNIPLLSYIILKGHCRKCKARISFRYFLVELITGITFILFFHLYGPVPLTFIYLTLACGLIIATFIDFEHQIIPDEITLGGLVLGLLVSLLYPNLHHETAHLRSLLDSVLGVLVGGGSLYLTGLLGTFIFKKDAMGGGDVKLLAMLGAFLGWRLVVVTFFVSPVLGSIVGIILKIKDRREVIPYGPYLTMGAIVAIIWGEDIFRWLFFR